MALFILSKAVNSGNERVFKRFPRLNVLYILHLENLLVQIEDDLLRADGCASLEKFDELGALLKTYSEFLNPRFQIRLLIAPLDDALITMKVMVDIPEGDLGYVAKLEVEKARQLHEPNYIGSADSLTTVNIGIQRPRDRVRQLWQRVLPWKYTYEPGAYRRKMDQMREARGVLPG